MPRYDYHCSSCNKREEFIGASDMASPLCCDAPMKRLVGSFAFANEPNLMAMRAHGRHRAWLESKEVQSDLRSGKREVPSKSDDIYHE